MTTENSTEQPLRFQVYYTGGPHTVPEWYLCSEWASQQAAADYCQQMSHFNAGSCFAVIDLWSLNVRHEIACDSECHAEENGLSFSSDDTKEWYAFYSHDTFSYSADGEECYGLSCQIIAGPAPSESSIRALVKVLETADEVVW